MAWWRAGLAGLALLLCTIGSPASAQVPPVGRASILTMLCSDGGQQVPQAVRALLDAVTTAPAPDRAWGARIVQAFTAKALQCASDGTAFLAGGLSAETLEPASPPDGLRAPLPSLRSRVLLEQASAALALFTALRPEDRLTAVRTLERRSDGLPPALLPAALAREADPAMRDALREAVAVAGLRSPDPAQRIAAIHSLGADPSSGVAAQLAGLRADPSYAGDPQVRGALDAEIARVRAWVAVGDALALLYNGVSAGSVLFLASVGLAIIFGLMGVINLAQGEFIMIGAYAAFCTQEALRAWAPGLVDWYPVLAVPVVFASTGLIGIAIEATVIRHLYRRPLMTLLATWAISLFLVNLVRVSFGTQNLQFRTPPYLAGGQRVLGDFLITWNHLGAILFAAAAFAATWALLHFTDLGLFIRAVTQNRGMAGCVGVPTRRIDMLAFGFGAGLAGLGGLALSPIYNVNPTMGSGFVIDSFMVVVLGGVGSLWGTALAALGIGLVNVGIEPFYGAVAAKVIALLLIILLIQWRPEGLIAARGRR
ncbi:MAG: urea ABC transporter permease subunit UrtB [Janthinobacterium lividum]